MIVGIDASNIAAGGGLTHLSQMLAAADPVRDGFTRVVVWSRTGSLAALEERPWLVKAADPWLNGHLTSRVLWQGLRSGALARAERCDVLFVPGGLYIGNFRPFVAMSQNLVPFETRERRRYGISRARLKFRLIRSAQARTFGMADGVVFLTDYARGVVSRYCDPGKQQTMISHGLDARLRCAPRDQRPIEGYSFERPFRILYVSVVDLYKHQWHVAAAVVALRAAGVPVVLDLVGPAHRTALALLNRRLDALDPRREAVRYEGAIPHDTIAERYRSSDAFVFASSCENLPNTLLEAMAAGLPIACSDRGPMLEVLKNAGVYFDPEAVDSIVAALRQLIESPNLRASVAAAAFERTRSLSWSACAAQTFTFLADVLSSSRRAH